MLEEKKSLEIKTVEILFYSFPISFIIGNLFISIHTLLFILFSSFLIIKKKMSYKLTNLHWILICFFLYLFILTSIQFLTPGILNEYIHELSFENNPIFKSFALIRFFILICVINILFINKILNIKKFFLISLME